MPTSRNTFLMNKPWALWKYLKRRGENRFQLSQTQHISSCRPDGARAAPFNSLLESCRRCAIKSKPARSKRVGAQPWQQVRACQEERCFPGARWSCAGSDLRHRRPTLPENTLRSRKKQNIWGQSERKMLRGREPAQQEDAELVSLEVHGSALGLRRL